MSPELEPDEEVAEAEGEEAVTAEAESAAEAEAVSPEMTNDFSTNGPDAEPPGGAWGPGTAEEEPIAETEIRSSAEPEDSWPEAGPEWSVAKSEWDEAWPFHVYFFALAYVLVSCVAGYLVVSAFLQRSSSLRSTTSMSKTTVALSLMIISFSASRAVVLLVDPYFSDGVFPFFVARLLWSVGIPGFTASFSIMLLILLDTTKLSLAPPRFQKVGTVGIIWFLHLVVVVTTDLLVMYVQSDVRPLLVMCQLLFVLYGALVSLGYTYVGVKMKGNLKASSSSGGGGGRVEDDQTRKIRRLVLMTHLSSGVAMSVAVLNVYTTFSQFGPYAGVRFIQPWPYWSVHTILRFLEVSACGLVLMLFFRSENGRQLAGVCGKCSCWQKKGLVHPGSERSENREDVTTLSSSVAGIMWRQRKDSVGSPAIKHKQDNQ